MFGHCDVWISTGPWVDSPNLPTEVPEDWESNGKLSLGTPLQASVFRDHHALWAGPPRAVLRPPQACLVLPAMAFWCGPSSHFSDLSITFYNYLSYNSVPGGFLCVTSSTSIVIPDMFYVSKLYQNCLAFRGNKWMILSDSHLTLSWYLFHDRH